MLEITSASGVLDSEPDFLQRDATVVVAAENLNARFLERAEETSFSRGLIVLTLAVVRAIPNGRVAEESFRSSENRHVVRRDWLVSLLQCRARSGDLRGLRGCLRSTFGSVAQDDGERRCD
jgi:hypothetical protein